MRARALGVGLLAGVFSLLSAGVLAHAVTLTTAPETESFSLTAATASFSVENTGTPPTTVTLFNPPAVPETLTFNQFNAGLGTLTGVAFTFTTTYGASATVTVPNNGDEESIDFSADASIDHSLAGAGVITTQSSLQTFSATCTADPDESCTQTQTPSTVSFNTPGGGVPLAAPLAFFVGNGTYDLTATLESILGPRISPDNGTDFADNTTFTGTLSSVNWSGNVSVVYTYETDETSVPAPLSFYLLGAGLAGVALWRRYRP